MKHKKSKFEIFRIFDRRDLKKNFELFESLISNDVEKFSMRITIISKIFRILNETQKIQVWNLSNFRSKRFKKKFRSWKLFESLINNDVKKFSTRITIISKIFRILNETQKIQVQVRNLRSQTNEKKFFTVPLKTIFKKRKKKSTRKYHLDNASPRPL